MYIYIYMYIYVYRYVCINMYLIYTDICKCIHMYVYIKRNIKMYV